MLSDDPPEDDDPAEPVPPELPQAASDAPTRIATNAMAAANAQTVRRRARTPPGRARQMSDAISWCALPHRPVSQESRMPSVYPC